MGCDCHGGGLSHTRSVAGRGGKTIAGAHEHMRTTQAIVNTVSRGFDAGIVSFAAVLLACARGVCTGCTVGRNYGIVGPVGSTQYIFLARRRRRRPPPCCSSFTSSLSLSNA